MWQQWEKFAVKTLEKEKLKNVSSNYSQQTYYIFYAFYYEDFVCSTWHQVEVKTQHLKRNQWWMCSFWGQSQVHMPVLQQVLGILDLVLCPCDGDDAVLRAL